MNSIVQLEDLTGGDRFMGAVLAARGDEVVVEAAAGFADAGRAIPNTTGTRFRIASLTKSFTAEAVRRLPGVDAGHPLAAFLPEVPRHWRSITLRQLIEHSSGIPNYTDARLRLRSGLSRHGATPRQVLDLVARWPLEFTPGTKRAYSNSGYLLLGLLIERISGRTYGEFLRETFFEPLGMSDTGYGHPPDDGRRACGYRLCGDDLEPADYIHIDVAYSAGGLYSTARDLFTWLRTRPPCCFQGSIAGFSAAMRREGDAIGIVLANIESVDAAQIVLRAVQADSA